jgi:hypothetical protein
MNLLMMRRTINRNQTFEDQIHSFHYFGLNDDGYQTWRLNVITSSILLVHTSNIVRNFYKINQFISCRKRWYEQPNVDNSIVEFSKSNQLFMSYVPSSESYEL